MISKDFNLSSKTIGGELNNIINEINLKYLQYHNDCVSIFEFSSDLDPYFIFTASLRRYYHNAIGTTNHQLRYNTFEQYFTSDHPLSLTFMVTQKRSSIF